MRIVLALLLLLAWPGLAVAQTGEPAAGTEPETKGEVFDVPRGESAKAYLERVGSRVSTDARYLSADAPIDLVVTPLPDGEPEANATRGQGTGGNPLAWIVMALVLGALGFALYQARFGDLFASAEPAKPKPRKVELADMGSADLSGLSPDALARMDDPREALRLLLIHALVVAADANGIALRRSFTARDVLARVPGSWGSRKLLEAIVRRGELVLFGGRPFGRDDLATVLEAAAPLFAPDRSRRGAFGRGIMGAGRSALPAAAR